MMLLPFLMEEWKESSSLIVSQLLLPMFPSEKDFLSVVQFSESSFQNTLSEMVFEKKIIHGSHIFFIF